MMATFGFPFACGEWLKGLFLDYRREFTGIVARRYGYRKPSDSFDL
jgi:hypothetical protein